MTATPETIRTALAHVPAHDRDLWVRMGMAVKAALGDTGFDIWDAWSASADNYNAKDARDAWRSFKEAGKVGIGSLIYEAKQNGYKPNGDARLMDPAEIERHKRERAEAVRRQEAELAQKQKDALKIAQAIYKQAQPATNEHPYLKRKGVKAYRGVGVSTWPQRNGKRDCLLVPIRDEHQTIWNLQAIFPEFDRELERDRDYLWNGKKQGCYFSIGKPGGAIVVCEGYATGASIHDATGIAVAVAFDKGNLLPVARKLRARFPDARIILGADNDIVPGKPNYGMDKAIEAAREVGGVVAVPELDGKKTDFNDLFQAKGPEAVKAAIAAAQVPPVAQTPTTAHKANGGDPGAAVDIVEGWPKPQELPAQLPPVLPFSFDLLPAGLRPWIEDVSERIQCPPEFPAVGALVALGSVIGRKLAVRPRERDDWHEFPNLWGMIIGSPGVLKSPALNEALRPLRRLEAQAAELHGGTLAAWQAEREGGKIRREAAKAKARQAAMKGAEFDTAALVAPNDEEEPKARRYIVNDCSVEALGEVLRSSPNGVLAFRDELSGLLKSMEREGNESARAFYLSAYSGKEAHVFDRIGRGLNLRVDHCCVSMLGSIQPNVIGQYLREAIAGGGSDGLLSRFSLLVWPDVSGEWRNVDRWPETAARQAVSALFERMDKLEPGHVGAEREEGEAPFLRFAQPAGECFVEWRKQYESKQRAGEDHPALVAHFAKYRKLVPALALVFHLADDGSGPIGEAALLRALGWAEILESHARRAYASIQQARAESARTLLAKIKATTDPKKPGYVPNPIRLRDVYLKGWSGLSEPEEARQAADLLHELDYLSRDTIQTGGRSATVYWISPRVRARV